MSKKKSGVEPDVKWNGWTQWKARQHMGEKQEEETTMET